MRRREVAFLYTGQPIAEFPAWLRFSNFAQSNDGSLLVIHGLDDVIRVRPGQTLYRSTDAQMRVADSSDDPAPAAAQITFVAELARDQRLLRGV